MKPIGPPDISMGVPLEMHPAQAHSAGPAAACGTPARTAPSGPPQLRRRTSEPAAATPRNALAELPAEVMQQVAGLLPTGRDRVALAATDTQMREVLAEDVKKAKKGHEEILEKIQLPPKHIDLMWFDENIASIAKLPEKLRGEALMMVIPDRLSPWGSSMFSVATLRAMEAAVQALPENRRPAGLAARVQGLRNEAQECGVRSAEQIIEALNLIRSRESNKTKVLAGMHVYNSEYCVHDRVRWGFDPRGQRMPGYREPAPVAILRLSDKPEHRALVARYDTTIDPPPAAAPGRARKSSAKTGAAGMSHGNQLLQDGERAIQSLQYRKHGMSVDQAAHKLEIAPQTLRHLVNPDWTLRNENELQALEASLRPFQVAGFRKMIQDALLAPTEN